MPKYAARADSTQQPIIEALRKAGWEVYLIRKPVDLLCVQGSVSRLIECKTASGKRNPTAKWRKDQEDQNEFCRRTNTPRVTTPEEALAAVSKASETGLSRCERERVAAEIQEREAEQEFARSKIALSDEQIQRIQRGISGE
jgi:hypothetical protein